MPQLPERRHWQHRAAVSGPTTLRWTHGALKAGGDYANTRRV
jgi:hypothetical protein